MREEGIFFYFDHDEDGAAHEVLVLADSNTNRPLVRPSHDGVIEYEEQEERREGREVAFAVERHHRVGATDAVVHGFDWTNPDLNVHHERTERADWTGPRLEVYDHHHAVRHHGYDDGAGSYQSHSADQRSRLHTERLDLARAHHGVSTTVVTAQPGHAFELRGTDDHDGRYVIVSMTSTGGASAHGGTYTNWLRVIPHDVPYRPPQPERPVMAGPETAIVVGPPGEEIHTDRHGRIKVQFHWDRQGQRNEHSSAWVRVMQSWAGPGWGFVFIPRIGMEVIVSFLGGDPDRPIVTGCVYNGTNTPPYPLPDEKTKSTIKTNSSLGGGGSNELRFEDKKGSEEVYIHAEKDFNELVENNHSTRVGNCQTNTVKVDQKENIGRDQTLVVDNDRTKTVKGNEKNEIEHSRMTAVGAEGGDDTLHVFGNRWETVDGPVDRLWVRTGDKFTNCLNGFWQIDTNKHFKVRQGAYNEFTLDEYAYLNAADSVQIRSGNGGGVRYHALADGALTVTGRECGIKFMEIIGIGADGKITLTVGASVIEITEDAIVINAPKVSINGTNLVDVQSGGFVKIKC